MRQTSTKPVIVALLDAVRDTPLSSVKKSISKYLPKPIKIWLNNQVMKARALAGKGLVPTEDLKLKYKEALLRLAQKQGGDNLGDYLEFGVAHGSSLACMHVVVQELGFQNIRLFGFDSFEGMPPESTVDDGGGHWYPGQFKSEYEFTKKLLGSRGVDFNRTTLVKGWFNETLTDELVQQHQIKKASVIMIDCDLYSSTQVALDFCEPFIHDEAIIFFDDWNSFALAEQNMGEKRAFTEFLQKHPEFTAEELGGYTQNAQYDTSTSFFVSRKK